jgi:hypothetical protein
MRSAQWPRGWGGQVLYTATRTGTYDVSVIYGGSGINQSPFRLTVQPARRHLRNSPTTGQALTLSTAGVHSRYGGEGG